MKETRFLPDFCPGTIRGASSVHNRKNRGIFGLANFKLFVVVLMLMMLSSEAAVLAKGTAKRSKTVKVQAGQSGTSYY